MFKNSSLLGLIASLCEYRDVDRGAGIGNDEAEANNGVLLKQIGELLASQAGRAAASDPAPAPSAADRFNLALREQYRAVREHWDAPSPEELRLVVTETTLAAVKAFRARTGFSLLEAKNRIEAAAARLGLGGPAAEEPNVAELAAYTERGLHAAVDAYRFRTRKDAGRAEADLRQVATRLGLKLPAERQEADYEKVVSPETLANGYVPPCDSGDVSLIGWPRRKHTLAAPPVLADAPNAAAEEAGMRWQQDAEPVSSDGGGWAVEGDDDHTVSS